MINKTYSEFLGRLNLEWCLIKDYDYLASKGYDNEIDLVTLGKNKSKIRSVASKLGWQESALNSGNTHLIFWKFEGLKPFRIDVHVDKVLATAVPWFDAEDILKDRVKVGKLWKASPKWELGVLILSSLRGRTPKKYRMAKAKKLKKYLDDIKSLFKGRFNGKEVEVYYNKLVKGKTVKLSSSERLGTYGQINLQLRHFKLFLIKLFNPSPTILLLSKDAKYRNKVFTSFVKLLRDSKMNIKFSKIKKSSEDHSLSVIFKRIMSDLVVFDCEEICGCDNTVLLNPKDSVDTSIKKILRKLW